MDTELLQAIRAIIREELAPLRVEVDALRENIEFLKWTLIPIESKIEAQIESINALSANIDYLKWTLTPMETSIKTLGEEVNSLKTPR